MIPNPKLKDILLAFLLFYLLPGIHAQRFNGGVADGYDAASSASFTTNLVSKFNGGPNDGYGTGASVNYTTMTVSKFGGGMMDGYASLFGVYQNLNQGVISGTITDHETGAPLYRARVSVTGGSFTSPGQITGFDGKFTINNVPFGTGYKIIAIKSGYETGELKGVNISLSLPYTTVPLSIYPLNGPYFVQQINPNPNPAVSGVFQGGKFHRYYKIVNAAGLACPDAAVVIQSQNGTLYDDDFVTDASGIVDISLGNADVGSLGQTKSFNIIQINNQLLSMPISFNAQVVSPQYSKYWETTGFAEIGATFCYLNLSLEAERGYVLSVVEEDAGHGIPEHIDCERQGKAGYGIGFKVKSPEVGCKLGVIEGKAGAEAGAGLKFLGITEDSYRFGYNPASNYEAIAKYIITADGGFNALDNTLIRLLTVCENFFTNQSTLNSVFVSDAIGLDVVAHAEAEASAGVGIPNKIGVGAGINIGAEGHVTFKGINHYQENQKEFEFGISGKIQGSAEAGIKIEFKKTPPLKEVETMLQLYDLSSTRGITFSVVMNRTTNAIEAYKICMIRKGSDSEEKITYTITGSQALAGIGNLEAEISSLNQSASAASSVNIGNSTFNRILDKVFSFLFNMQNGNPSGACVTYSKEVTPTVHSSSVNVGVSLGFSVVDAEIGGGGEFEEGTRMIVDEGRWIYGRHFPTTTFSGTIPSVPVDHQFILQKIINDLPLSLRVMIGVVNFFRFGVSEQSFFIGNQGSFIDIPDGAVPAGVDTLSCTSWGWYGDTITSRLDNIQEGSQKIYTKNRQSAEEMYGMTYGIGGFYQFEPYNTVMSDTCWLTIKYTQDEVKGIDESSLGVYWEDKTNQKWRYIAGIVDTVANKVTAPVTFLSLFTLAPSQPYGTVKLNPSTDSLYADSTTTMAVLSDTLFNNDSSKVKDHERFTVSTSLGTVISTDIDALTPGIQVAAMNGRIQFAVRSSGVAGNAVLSAFSVNGSARGDTSVVFFDTITPGTPVNLKGVAGNECAYLKWNRTPGTDIAGYKVYFDSDLSGPPYNGHASVNGFPSPISLGIDTACIIRGLYNDSSYYFTITSYDVSGNESRFSNEVLIDLRLSDTLWLGENEVKNRDTLCFNATNFIELPMQYTSFSVDSGGSATLIAGERISMKPGSRISRGGYLHASITLGSNFCNTFHTPGLPYEASNGNHQRGEDLFSGGTRPPFFNIYPNPTTAKFTLELTKEPTGSPILVRVYNMMGTEIMNKQMAGVRKSEFSLENQLPGIYLVSVMQEGRMEKVKVIRY